LRKKGESSQKRIGIFSLRIAMFITWVFALGTITLTAIWMVFFNLPQMQTQDTALVLAKDGMNRILATRYENMSESNFPMEHIDVDSNGKSLFESLRYVIKEDSPY